MHVTITLYGPSREVVGEKTVERTVEDGATVEEVFRDLIGEYPDLSGKLLAEDGGLPTAINVARNGTSIDRDEGLATPVADGDELRVAHSLRGG